MPRYAAALLLMLSACSSAQPTKPAPIPPVTVAVPVAPDLPADATTPCQPRLPAAEAVQTDVDLAGMAAVWRATALCNARKLRAIGSALGPVTK